MQLLRTSYPLRFTIVSLAHAKADTLGTQLKHRVCSECKAWSSLWVAKGKEEFSPLSKTIDFSQHGNSTTHCSDSVIRGLHAPEISKVPSLPKIVLSGAPGGQGERTRDKMDYEAMMMW